MQVMNNDQFNQNEILIGGAGKTRSFKVSDDPMLMSMLSTGFYANPHRAMIQETMFNAWDAHRMGKCQDKPIDIYISSHNGFTVRDYGPGIPDDLMEDVYCTYAASTKRDDADMTGGFGLGSKSPWSYTESFTVTSHNNGVKTMYLMSRVSDEAENKPGMTTLMSFATEETGLAVSVPIQDNGLHNTRRVVKDVLYLSGIKARIHFKDEEPQLIESMEVAPAQYVMDTRQEHASTRNIYAVYGGVRYLIPEKDEYSEEFQFMNTISEIASLYIGFAPHSLSPLPNREGLNMSTNTKENIRAGLELCMERFQTVFDPVIHAYFRDRMDNYKAGGVQAHFALFHALAHYQMGNSFMTKFQEKMLPLCPPNTDKTVWFIALTLLTKSIKSIVLVIGKDRWMSILLAHFIRVYPDAKNLAFNVRKKSAEELLGYHHTGFIEDTLAAWTQPEQLNKLFQFENKLLEEFPENDGFMRPKIRLQVDNDWPVFERNRNAPKGLSHRFVMRSSRKVGSKQAEAPIKYLCSDRLWYGKNGEEVEQFMLSNTVILAKTVNALRDTDVPWAKYLSTDNRYSGDYYKHRTFGKIPAYVVHSRKGWYDKALEILTNLGFHVIEANEPEKRSYHDNGKPRQIVKQYCRINTSRNDWKASEIDPDSEDYDPQEDGVPLTDPTHYLYIKQSDLEAESYYHRGNPNKPSKTLMHYFLQMHPDVAMVNNQTQADKLEKDGAKKFEELVIAWHKSMGKKVYRLRNIVRVIQVMDKSNIHQVMIKDPIIQAAMGITKIKEDDSAFWEEMHIINTICEEHYSPLRTTASEMKTLVDKVWDDDPQKAKIKTAIKVTGLLSEHALEQCWRGLDKDEQQDFAQKLARFIRTM